MALHRFVPTSARRRWLPAATALLTVAFGAAPTPANAEPNRTTTTTTATTTKTHAAITTARPATAAAPTTGFRFLDIRSFDGTVLKANLIAPAAAGPHPAIVLVSSWGLNDAQYLVQAKTLAGAGYVVLSYTTRGFWGSGGEVETAGPPDVADVSAVLDWLVGNTAADPGRIGLGGVSYGAGIALLGAAHDPRVRVVTALSGWSDLVESLYGNRTRHPQAVSLLYLAAKLFGRPSPELDDFYADYLADRNVPTLMEWGRIRSPGTYLDGLRANRPAVLLANAYGDSIFGPNPLVEFFGRLAGPKRLELAAGDHVIPEITGLAGLPNHVWTSVRRWFDEHLRGVDTGIGREPVVLRVRNTGAVEAYTDWADVSGTATRWHLADVPWYDWTGPLTATPAGSGWTESFRADRDTVAGAGVVLLSNGLEALTGIPATAWLPAVSRLDGAVWSTPLLPRGAAVRGIARVHLTLRPSAATGTVVAYLYDVDALGTGRLVTHVPYTWADATPGAALTVETALPATAWDVPAGHRLALVVDAADPLYLDANPRRATVAVTGPSWIDVPVR